MKSKLQLQDPLRKSNSAVLVVNTHSRKGEKLYLEAIDELTRQGVTLTASHAVRNPALLAEVIQKAIRQEEGQVVIVGGGDGTISSAVDSFAHSDAVFALLPLGTSNSFAKTLGIPKDLKGAVEVIVGRKVAVVDLGSVDGDFFANVVSFGLTADVAMDTPHLLKRFLGPLAYGLVGIKHFFLSPSFECELEHEGKKETLRTHQVIVANGRFFGLSPVAPFANVDSRQLVVFTMETRSRWQLLRFWVAFLFNGHNALAGVKRFSTKELRVTTKPIKRLNIDGEAIAQTPVTISIAPGALKVLVPQSFDDRD